MNQLKCRAGHYYDPQKHTSCPYCGVRDLDLGLTRSAVGATVEKREALRRCPFGHYYDSEKYADCPSCRVNKGAVGVTQAKRDPYTAGTEGKPSEEGKTQAFFESRLGINPVVGWLVCVEGSNRGRDYRLCGERNWIGRSEEMDVCLSGDLRVSRENHASVVYNPNKNLFRLHPGESRSLVYLNDDEVVNPVELKGFDVISIGESKLLFVPLCGDSFKWL